MLETTDLSSILIKIGGNTYQPDGFTIRPVSPCRVLLMFRSSQCINGNLSYALKQRLKRIHATLSKQYTDNYLIVTTSTYLDVSIWSTDAEHYEALKVQLIDSLSNILEAQKVVLKSKQDALPILRSMSLLNKRLDKDTIHLTQILKD